ncbi:HAD family hydrolase [Ascidiimonas sp. W6]|uniref:HAD family hydrolase n=1 Tax=Ascidiimonas meishanensis TaxID=3128903 RepID=UPI0030EB26D8
MNLENVKLVVADMDGTLLNSKGQVSKRFFELFNLMSKKNIEFIAASGRQYYSIIDKLKIIKDDITIIAENGGIAKKQDKQLLIHHLSSIKINSFIKTLRKIPGVYIVLCGRDSAYIETRNKPFIDVFSEYYHKYQIVEDLTKVKDDLFLKIASYHFENSENHIYPKIKQFEDNYQVKVSGLNWLDISHPMANKGNALRLIQQKLGINSSQTMVFGDYNNDLEMLQLGHFSYAMENAHSNVKKIANYHTTSNDDYGVERVLEKLITAIN